MTPSRFTVDPHILDNTDLSKVEALRHWQHQLSVLLEQLENAAVQYPPTPSSTLYLDGTGHWSAPAGGGGAPAPHAPTHISTGTDPISIVSASATGLVPILANTATKFLRDDGTWQTGPTGPPGSTGPAGANAWTLSTTSTFTIPAVGSSVTANCSDTSWAAVGEYIWVQSSPTTADALQITAKTSTSLTLLNPTSTGMAGTSYWDAVNGLYFYDDLTYATLDTNRYATNIGGGGTAVGAATYGQANTALKILGGVELTTGATNSANQGVGLFWGGSTAAYPILYGLGTLSWKSRIFLEGTLPTTGINYMFRAGIGQMLGSFYAYANNPIQGFFFEYDPGQNSGQWRVAYATTGAATYTNTSAAVAGDTAYNLEIALDTTWANLVFKINGVVVATLSSGFPKTVYGAPVWAIGRGTGSTTNYKAAIDSWMINYTFTR